MIKTRFAPSPTGFMHIANLRVAIFNWLFAKKNNGDFLIRIEDTDSYRSKQIYEKNIFDILDWMNIDYSSNILKQSKRFNIYLHYTKLLLDTDQAFYCQCTFSAKIQQDWSDQTQKIKCQCRNLNLNSGVIRFKTPIDGYIEYQDMVFGKLSVKCKDIEDFALIRSDKTATYCLAVVIDDYATNITHIIRGEDHKTNTFKQILLYKAFNWNVPHIGHLSIIKGIDGQKLSKRHGDTSVENYKNKGMIPDSLFNILVKLGWGYKNEELMTKNRILEIFDFKDIKKSSCIFDEVKLWNFSGQFIRKNTYINELNLSKDIPKNFIITLYPEIAKRCNNLIKMRQIYNDIYFYHPKIIINPEIINQLIPIIQNNFDDMDNQFRSLKIPYKDIAKTIRINLTGMEFSPNIIDIIKALGQTTTLAKLSI